MSEPNSNLVPEVGQLEYDGESIVAIEYTRTKSGWKPCQVMTEGSAFDFNWCETSQTLAYNMSGGGGGTDKVYNLAKFCDAPKLCAKLWYDHRRCKIVYEGKPVCEREARALGYHVIHEPLDGNPFDDSDAVNDHTEWCSQCQDHYPSEGVCNHLIWSDDAGVFIGCGSDDIDFGETQASLYRLLQMLSKDAVNEMRQQALRRRNPLLQHHHDLLESFGGELRYEERYWPGIAWLSSLDGTAKDAMALTAGWIWAFQQNGWQACYRRKYFFSRNLPDKALDEWLAINPLEPEQLHDRPLRVKLEFKPQCANDIEFIKDPERCHEVVLWPNRTSKRTAGECGLTLSVAEVRRVSAKAVDVYFGAIVERNGKHISEMKDRSC